MKTFKQFREGVENVTEAPVDGVAKGSLPKDDHMCEKKFSTRSGTKEHLFLENTLTLMNKVTCLGIK